jgi:DNA-binding IclR family transcriptional regulator
MTLVMPTLLPTMTAATPSVPRERKERRGIQSIEVGGKILMALSAAARPMPLGELAKAAHMPTGKIHPYLVSFTKIGLAAQDPVTGHYLVGPAAIQLGLSGLQSLNPIREATPLAEALAFETSHSVALVVWGNLGPTVVRLIESSYPLHVNMRTGTVMSLANTATGRLFAAYLAPQLIEKMMREDHSRLGPDIAPPLPPKKVAAMLAEVRQHGLSRAINSPTPSVSAFAAPVFDYSGNIVLCITLMGSSGVFDTHWDSEPANALRACARDVSKRLGHDTSRM